MDELRGDVKPTFEQACQSVSAKMGVCPLCGMFLARHVAWPLWRYCVHCRRGWDVLRGLQGAVRLAERVGDGSQFVIVLWLPNGQGVAERDGRAVKVTVGCPFQVEEGPEPPPTRRLRPDSGGRMPPGGGQPDGYLD